MSQRLLFVGLLCWMSIGLAAAQEQFSLNATGNSPRFTENKGQVSDQHDTPRPDVLFYGETQGLKYFLRKQGLSYQQVRPISSTPEEEQYDKNGRLKLPETSWEVYRTDISWVGANPTPMVTAERAESTYQNFYTAVCPDGVTNVQSFQEVRYAEVYPGIDLLFYDGGGALEYDFLVAAGTDPNVIQWTIAGAEQVTINEQGQLVVQTPFGEFLEEAPVAFQECRRVAADWQLQGDTVSFALGAYDHQKPLTIDPLVRHWGSFYGGLLNEIGRSVAVDQHHNAYFTGFTGSTNAIATTGSHQATLDSLHDGFIAKFGVSGGLLWATYHGGKGQDDAYDAAIGPAGNLYVTGGTNSATGMATSGAHQPTYGGGQDAFLAKFSPNGIRQWSTYMGGYLQDEFSGVAVDDDHNVYVTGTSFSNDSIATPGSHQAVPGGHLDIVVAKFDSSGTRKWSTYMGGGNEDVGFACDIKNNRLFVTGLTESNDSISTTGSHQPTKAVSWDQDAFLACFDTAGVLDWCTYYGGPKEEIGWAVIADHNGNSFITGRTFSETDISTTGSHQPAISSPNWDSYLVKFDSAGVRQWGTYVGGPSYDVGWDLEVDPQNNVYLGGETMSTSSIGITGTYQDNHGGLRDGFLTRYSPSGDLDWGTFYGGNSSEEFFDIAVRDSGSIYAIGRSNSTLGNVASTAAHQTTFGGGTPYGDGLIVRFGSGCATSSSVVVSSCGPYISPVDSDTFVVAGIYIDTLVGANSAGCDSIIITNFTITSLLIQDTISVNACDSYTSPSGNAVWTGSGTYIDTLLSSQFGCDSLLQVELTIFNPAYDSTTVTACNSYVPAWGGSAITQSGIYTGSVSGAVGGVCDSIYWLDLTIIPSSVSTMTVTSCNSYDLPVSGLTVTQSGTYHDTLAAGAASGCDSIVEVNLTILPSPINNLVETACEMYTAPSGNHTWTTSGSYLDTLVGAAANGCDSIIQIDLTILQPASSVLIDSSCTAYTSPSGNFTWTSSGTYLDTLAGGAANGCDSVVEVQLTIFGVPVSDTITVTACNSFTPWGGPTWTSSGVYLDTVSGASVHGCDSVLIFDLTIITEVYGVIQDTGCGSLVSPFGNYTWTTSGIYSDTLPGGSVGGCDSIVVVDAEVTHLDMGVQINGFTLISQTDSADSYQWASCETGILPGATQKSFTPELNGEYAVIVGIGECVDTSACYAVSIVGVSETSQSKVPRVYPVPSGGALFVEFEQFEEQVDIQLYDALGQQVLNQRFTSMQVANLQLPAAAGVYWMQVSTSNNRWTFPVVRE